MVERLFWSTLLALLILLIGVRTFLCKTWWLLALFVGSLSRPSIALHRNGLRDLLLRRCIHRGTGLRRTGLNNRLWYLLTLASGWLAYAPPCMLWLPSVRRRRDAWAVVRLFSRSISRFGLTLRRA